MFPRNLGKWGNVVTVQLSLIVNDSSANEISASDLRYNTSRIDEFRYIKIQSKTIDLNARLWGITTELVGFIPQSLVLTSIVLG